MRTSPWSLHSRPPNRYFRWPLRSPTPLPQAHRRARRRAPGPQLPAGVCRAVGSAGGYRAVGWPQARAEAAKSEGSRLAAAEEMISRERNVGFAGAVSSGRCNTR